MKLAAACMLMCLALGTVTEEGTVSFRSKLIGKLNSVPTKTEAVVSQESTEIPLPWKPVSFSSARKIGGNY